MRRPSHAASVLCPHPKQKHIRWHYNALSIDNFSQVSSPADSSRPSFFKLNTFDGTTTLFRLTTSHKSLLRLILRDPLFSRWTHSMALQCSFDRQLLTSLFFGWFFRTLFLRADRISFSGYGVCVKSIPTHPNKKHLMAPWCFFRSTNFSQFSSGSCFPPGHNPLMFLLSLIQKLN